VQAKKWTSFQDPLDSSTASSTLGSAVASKLTSADWHRDFLSKLDDPNAQDPFADGDDEFGNFASADDGSQEFDMSANENNFGDFDFSESGFGDDFGQDLRQKHRESLQDFPVPPDPPSPSVPVEVRSTSRQSYKPPISPALRQISAAPSPSLSMSPPISPIAETGRPSTLHHRRRSSTSSGSSGVALASWDEPLGPGVPPNAHLTEDGKVAVPLAEGLELKVPADEIALTIEEQILSEKESLKGPLEPKRATLSKSSEL
jgi:hypothetical protein